MNFIFMKTTVAIKKKSKDGTKSETSMIKASIRSTTIKTSNAAAWLYP